MKDIEELVYELMCSQCPYAKECHESCTTCEEYEDEVNRRVKDDSSIK